MTLKVYLAAEGMNELGDWCHTPPYRKAGGAIGVLEALLGRIAPEGWRIEDAICWKDLRHVAIDRREKADAMNVRRAALKAAEAGCDILVFCRDRDGEPTRGSEIEEAIAVCGTDWPELRLVGGVAVEKLEAWLLAMHADRRAESRQDPASALGRKKGLSTSKGHVTTTEMVEIVLRSDLTEAAARSTSLALWLRRARAAFTPSA